MSSKTFVYLDYNRKGQSRHIKACIMIPVYFISYNTLVSDIKRSDKDSVALSFSQLFRQKRALLASCGCTGG